MTGKQLSVDEILGRAVAEPEMSNEEKFAELMKRMGKKWDPTEVH
jgi:hypothetical protein